jgi:methyl-accepting chemotaxis protein
MKRKGAKTMIGPMTLIVTALIVASFFIAAQVVYTKFNNARKTQDANIKSQTEMAITLLTEIEKKRGQGFYSMAQAKQMGADMLRNLRYGEKKDGYFWADTSKGVNVVLLGDKTVEGKNRLEAKLNGVSYIKEIIKQGMMPNGEYTNYFFNKPGNTVLLEKRAYSLYFKPFDWVVGTGYYVQDVK